MRSKRKENNMSNLKVWIVEVRKQKVYPFFEGKDKICANDLNDLANFRRKLQEDNRTIFGRFVLTSAELFLKVV